MAANPMPIRSVTAAIHLNQRSDGSPVRPLKSQNLITMALKTFDSTAKWRADHSEPVISIKKDGTFVFNKGALKHLDLDEDEGVKFFQVEETRNWYIGRDKLANHALKIKLYKGASPNCFSSKATASAILETFKKDKLKLRIQEEPGTIDGHLLYKLVKY